MKNIEQLLKEIMELEPTLRGREEEVRQITVLLTRNVPNPVMDEQFVAELRAKLQAMSVTDGVRPLIFKTIFAYPYRLSFGLASASVVAVVALLFIPFLGTPITSRAGIVALAPNAFGALTGGSALTTTEDSDRAIGLAETATPVPSSIARPQSGGGGALGAGSASVDAKMIAPNFPPASLTFTGEPIEITEASLPVYRRFARADFMNQLAISVANQPNGIINLNSQGGLQLTNFQVQGQDGLVYSVDLREGRLYVSPWYEAQVFPDREPTESDMLPDGEVISIADAFLNQLGIDRSAYGEPVVDQSWRGPYLLEKTLSAVAYVPSVMNVTYPLVIDGNTIYEMGGNPFGLSVQVNILSRRAIGAGNISALNFEKSNYDIETDFVKIVSVAEKGGMYGFWYSAEGTTELQLGTPEMISVQYYSYDEATRQNAELYVPALRFPIMNAPDNYYGQKQIVVPIVKDILKVYEQTVDQPIPTEPGPAIQLETKPETRPSAE